MNWQQIRETYPGNWVVVEALNAHTEGVNRVLDQLELVAAFGDDSHAAWAHYERIHKSDRTRELYVLHTDRQDLNIGILDTFGRAVVDK
jgi:hypothetical protein